MVRCIYYNCNTMDDITKMIKNFVSGLILISVGIAGTQIYQYLYPPPAEIKIVEKTKIVTKYIDRDYSAMSRDGLASELMKYDKGQFLLDGEMVSPETIHITGRLYRREAERDIKFKIKGTSNIRFYVGVGIVGALAGGYVVYKIKK